MRLTRDRDTVILRWVFLACALFCTWAGFLMAPVSWLLSTPCALAALVFLGIRRLL